MTLARPNRTVRVSQIDHVEMFVPDRYAAATWCQQLLGLAVLRDYEDWAKDRHGPLMISSDDGNTKLALFEGEPQGSRDTPVFCEWRSVSTGQRLSSFSEGCRMFLSWIGGGNE